MRILEDFLDNMGKDALVKKNARDVVVDDNEYEAIYTLPTLDYVAAPTTLAELTAFDTAVSGKTISLVFTFGIKA